MAMLLSRGRAVLGAGVSQARVLRRHVSLAPPRAAPADPAAAGKAGKAESNIVGKGVLAKRLAQDRQLTIKQATEIVDALLDDIMLSVAEGQAVTIPGFGSFKKRERAARTGRNPKSGEPIDIPATNAPGFTAGTVFKGVVKWGSWEAYEAEVERSKAAGKKK